MTPLTNSFTQGPVTRVLLRTALPIVLLTSINGVLTVLDAILLGAFVGPQALAAVTLMFPAAMVLIALSTMISSGMASIMARQLGAGQIHEARTTFGSAHALAAFCSLLLVALVVPFARPLIASVTPDAELVAMSEQFLLISVWTSPIMFLVSVHSDALRIEGRIGFMALAGLVVSLGNIACNIALIAGFGLGVAGSAWGTALAQALALALMLSFRFLGKAILPASLSLMHLRRDWFEIAALGASRSLSFLGIALGAGATITAVRLHVEADQDSIIVAYGVITRIMTFAYLPLLGLSLGMQAVVGNNLGAGLPTRVKTATQFSIALSLAYCATVEAILLLFKDTLGSMFVADQAVVAQVSRILPLYAALYLTLGPTMLLSSYLQSIGDARRAALLSLARTYVFAVPLTFALPLVLGESGIWLAIPLSDAMLVLTTLLIFARLRTRPTGHPPEQPRVQMN
jgi:putative MATE family efflux protein